MASPRAVLDGQLLNQSDYVCAAELGGRDLAVTITKVEIKDLNVVGSNQKKRKAVVNFDRCKPLVLNRTNEGTIVKLHGSNARDWAGKRITLYPTTTTFGKERMDCIRIREQAPAATGPGPAKPQGQRQQQPQQPRGMTMDAAWAHANAWNERQTPPLDLEALENKWFSTIEGVANGKTNEQVTPDEWAAIAAKFA